MKINYTLGQRCTAYLLLVSLLLQSCHINPNLSPNLDPIPGTVAGESKPLGLILPEQEFNLSVEDLPVEDKHPARVEAPLPDALVPLTTADAAFEDKEEDSELEVYITASELPLKDKGENNQSKQAGLPASGTTQGRASRISSILSRPEKSLQF